MNLVEEARKHRQIIEKAMSTVDDKTASQAVEFSRGMKYDGSLIAAGTRINWKGTLKRATVDLWDTVDNSPDNAPTLWENVAYRDGIRIIPDTITGSAVFPLGEYGWWQDKLYESLLDANVHTPEQNPAGWKEVTL